MVSEDSKFEETIQKGVNYYLNNMELQQAILHIPSIGTAVDCLFSGLGQRFQLRRLLQALQDLNEEISQVNESMIDKSFLNTEEFYDLIVKMEGDFSKRDRFPSLNWISNQIICFLQFRKKG